MTARPGDVLTYGGPALTNSSRHPARITRVWLTGIRHLTVDAIYANAFAPGAGLLGDESGWPPRGQRHRADGTVVPPGGNVSIIIVVTMDPGVYASGIDVRYTSNGQSYTQANQQFLGMAAGCGH